MGQTDGSDEVVVVKKKLAGRDWNVADVWRLKRAEHRAKKELPSEWLATIKSIAQDEMRVSDSRPYIGHGDARGVWLRWLSDFGGALAAQLSDGDIKERAGVFSEEAASLDMGRLVGASLGAWGEYERVINFCAARGVVAPSAALGLTISGIGKRVRCKYWWRRALRKMVAMRCELGAMSLGLVCQQRRQSYASNNAVFRRLDQNKRNAMAMENTALENEDGQRAVLAELAARSVSSKPIRRGELMTRIRGCEEIASAANMPGIFLTITCPSRFHGVLRTGKINKRHDGSTPKDAQLWLCRVWAAARAKLKRDGLEIIGFRVAEPHHDGCTHWHALLWAADGAALERVVAVVQEYFTRDDRAERGRVEHGVKAMRMERGGAAGYIAKYIAKNIDDKNIKSHLDDYSDGSIEPDLLGGVEIRPCMRVEAWAATWGIRQFQAIGQPPVTVWRELRRVTEKSARGAGYGGAIHSAWRASSGSWASYCKAQGGVMRGRDFMVALATERREVDGRYERAVRRCVIGVRINTPGSRCIYSERRLWRVVERKQGAGEFAGAKRAPWTRVNNCTHNKKRSSDLVRTMIESAKTGALHTEPRAGVGEDFLKILEYLRKKSCAGATV